jgi:hypothetical protein
MRLPFRKRERILGFVHVYCDESGKHKNNAVVSFVALCMQAKALEGFEERWKSLLRQYELSELHMVAVSRLSQRVGCRFERGQTAGERVELLKPFVDCINGEMETGLVNICDSQGFSLIPEKQRKALSDLKDPYHLEFIRGLDALAQYAPDDELAIVCDDDEDTAWESYRMYRRLRGVRFAIKDKIKSISFADSIAYPALQAADMVSYLSRKQGEFEWYSQPFELQALLSYLSRPQKPPSMQWKVARFSKEKLKDAKNWRTK